MDQQNIQVTEENDGKYRIERLNSLLININTKTTVQDVINSMKKKEEIENLDVFYDFKNAVVFDSLGQILTVIFRDPIKVIYYNILYKEKYVTLIQEKAYSTLELDEILKKFEVTKADCSFLRNGKRQTGNYFKSKPFLSNVLTRLEIINLDKKYILDENYVCLINKKIFSKQSLSKYCEKYLIYPTEKDDFELFNSDNRYNLMENLYKLKDDEDIIQFKLAGPSGGGKSITLLYFSRLFLNIIYLNFKVIYKLFNDFKIDECFDLILSEFGRLSFIEEKKEEYKKKTEEGKNKPEEFKNETEEYKKKKVEYKKQFESIFTVNQGNSPWQLISDISNFLKDKKVILIFDQFKSEYIPPNILKNIKNNLNNSFKIVFSSSINDGDIGNSVVNSLYTYRGNLILLDKSNQEYYVAKNWKKFFRKKMKIKKN